jgi:FKBP-type peptidyl-prolyl cis-trans isomerase SlpA
MSDLLFAALRESAMSQSEASSLAVDAHSYLTLHYRVSLDAPHTDDAERSQIRDVVSTFGARPATLQLGAGQLSPALEEQLFGLQVGMHRVFALPAGVAFGPRNPELVQRLPLKLLEAESDKTEYSPGDVVEFNAPGGGRYAGVFHSFDNDYAIFDFNHPLAGQSVRFEVQILGIM